jgi:superfamily I DNA/RNA helicase
LAKGFPGINSEAKYPLTGVTEPVGLRLLYVAMTRAEDELYIFGESGNKKDNNTYTN